MRANVLNFCAGEVQRLAYPSEVSMLMLVMGAMVSKPSQRSAYDKVTVHTALMGEQILAQAHMSHDPLPDIDGTIDGVPEGMSTATYRFRNGHLRPLFAVLNVPDRCTADKGSLFMGEICVLNTAQADEEDVMNDLVDNFETRDTDVFVCTYVKSGTTWMQQIISLLLNKGEQGDKTYAEIVPWLETAALGERIAVNQGPAQAPGQTLDAIAANKEQRFFKTHANIDDLPCGKAPGVKVIYMCRNPKDVCVSLHHHTKNRKAMYDYNGSLTDTLAFFAEGRCMNGSWFDHVLGWYEASKVDQEHVLFLRYEDMLAETEAHIKKIADFAGIETTPEIVAKTMSQATISAMKTNPKANIRPQFQHLRRGVAGGWRDEFTVRQSEAFDEMYREQMKGSGLEMDFGEGLHM